MTTTPGIRVPALMLLATLAACSGAPNTPEEACRAEARNSPTYKDLMSRLSGNNMAQREGILEDARAAERRAYGACMRARGAPAAGGVEAPRTPR